MKSIQFEFFFSFMFVSDQNIGITDQTLTTCVNSGDKDLQRAGEPNSTGNIGLSRPRINFTPINVFLKFGQYILIKKKERKKLLLNAIIPICCNYLFYCKGMEEFSLFPFFFLKKKVVYNIYHI